MFLCRAVCVVLFLEGKGYRMLKWGNLQGLRKDRNRLTSESLYTWIRKHLLSYLILNDSYSH